MAAPLAELLEVVVAVDARVVELVVALRSPLLTKVMTSVTGLGSATAALVVVGLFRLAGWHGLVRRSAVALLLAGVTVGGLMLAVQRPFPPHPVCVTDAAVAHSFPSGHAAAATVFTLVARGTDRLPTAPTALLAGAVAGSRIYLGTHYFSDTVAGVAIGIGAVLLARRLCARVDWPSWLAAQP
ncbi:phosphatase PAP2 family protein [Halosegnis sp.]|uniref:phosphatase PAP2 family protein n=1 Tax=Halosegnis sp. TaxID=2864959 RepID=UPI0035D4720B